MASCWGSKDLFAGIDNLFQLLAKIGDVTSSVLLCFILKEHVKLFSVHFVQCHLKLLFLKIKTSIFSKFSSFLLLIFLAKL